MTLEIFLIVNVLLAIIIGGTIYGFVAAGRASRTAEAEEEAKQMAAEERRRILQLREEQKRKAEQQKAANDYLAQKIAEEILKRQEASSAVTGNPQDRQF